jgi:hypothetical protein
MSKVKLTSSQIEDMLSFIQPNRAIPYDIAEKIVEQNKDRLRAQLKHIEIYESLIPKLAQSIQREYYSTLVQPGESVGIITAQSIGERQTQQTLNTFHSSGIVVKTVITGVPRFSELLNATKKPKAVSCNIFFNENNESIQSLREYVGRHIKHMNMSHFIKTYFIFSEHQTDDWYDVYEIVHGNSYEKYA